MDGGKKGPDVEDAVEGQAAGVRPEKSVGTAPALILKKVLKVRRWKR